MCDVIDHYLKIGEEKGVLIGFEKGRSEGELLGEAKTICAFYASMWQNIHCKVRRR